MLLECDGAVENYHNMKKLFSLLDLPSIEEPFKFTADYKLLRIILGLSGGNPKHGCPYCCGYTDKPNNVYKTGLARTLGMCRQNHQKFVSDSKAKLSKAKNHYNCIHPPIDLMYGMEDTWTLSLFPPGPLHTLLLGNFTSFLNFFFHSIIYIF